MFSLVANIQPEPQEIGEGGGSTFSAGPTKYVVTQQVKFWKATS